MTFQSLRREGKVSVNCNPLHYVSLAQASEFQAAGLAEPLNASDHEYISYHSFHGSSAVPRSVVARCNRPQAPGRQGDIWSQVTRFEIKGSPKPESR
jgi:hypothetical protein